VAFWAGWKHHTALMGIWDVYKQGHIFYEAYIGQGQVDR
jgi:hypothetical protein